MLPAFSKPIRPAPLPAPAPVPVPSGGNMPLFKPVSAMDDEEMEDYDYEPMTEHPDLYHPEPPFFYPSLSSPSTDNR